MSEGRVIKNPATWRDEWEAEILRFATSPARPDSRQVLAHMNQTFDREFTIGSIRKKLIKLGFRFARSEPGNKRQGPARGSVCARTVAAARDAATAPRPATKRPNPFVPDLSGLPGRRFTDLKPGQCKFEITGSHDRFAYRFCGARVVPLPPYAYCAEHAQQAYKLPEPRRR